MQGSTRGSGGAFAGALACVLLTGIAVPAVANVWIFEPSVSLDQRLDDNYRLETGVQREVSATRLVGDLGLSRRSRTATFTGGVRVDGLLTQGEYEGDELDSNQVFFLDTVLGDERTKWGADVSFKQDTPSRDISADLSSAASEATDSGVVTQRSNVARRQLIVGPSVTRALTRRASIEAGLKYTNVSHDLPTPQDAIYTRYLGLYNNQNAPDFNRDDIVPETAGGGPLPFDEVDNETVGVFTPQGELDDYEEARVDLSYRYSLSPISLVSATVSHSFYQADSEPADAVNVQFPERGPDGEPLPGRLVRDGETDIYRRPRGRDAVSTTSSFRLGYERNLTQTLRGTVQAGVYLNTTDDSDTFREGDRENYRAPLVPNLETDDPNDLRQQSADEYAASLETETDGWLANVSLTKDAGLTRYALRFGVDVQPSSVGSQVEAQELIGDVYRKIGPLLDASLRVRLYEPDRLGANPDDRFARRFLSFEPKVIWRFTRAWTAAASYRYRRQKSRVDPTSGESNALLFSLTYTPPSAIRDASTASGL